MKTLYNSLVQLIRDEDGAAASEYAVLVAVIAMAVAGAVMAFNLGGFNGIFDTVRAKVIACIGGSC